ncbi:hypothetical protein B7463_g12104, partial [Scytalidium lignicola]
MTSVQDSLIFGNIYSHPPAAKIWSDTTRTQYFLDLEGALARVQGRLGVIPEDAANAISEACTSLAFIDWDELRLQTELVGFPVLPLVKQLAKHVSEKHAGLGEWVHWGAMSQDITDTAIILQLRDTLRIVEELLTAIRGGLAQLCAKYKTTPMAARSNLSPTIPMTAGFKFARLLATFNRHETRLEELRKRLLVLQLGGASGNLTALAFNGGPEIGYRCQEALAKELDLQIPDIAWHAERDRIADFGFFMTSLTSTCAKFAQDVALEMQSEVAEMSEPFTKHRGGSSAMPHRRNPITASAILATATSVRHMGGALSESMLSTHEHDSGPCEVEWIALPHISALGCACLRHTRELVEGIKIDPTTMLRNLNANGGAYASETIMMALAPKMGRQRAHDLMYDVCHEAMQKGTSLFDVLSTKPESSIIPQEDLKTLCDPSTYLGMSESMVDAVLSHMETNVSKV